MDEPEALGERAIEEVDSQFDRPECQPGQRIDRRRRKRRTAHDIEETIDVAPVDEEARDRPPLGIRVHRAMTLLVEVRADEWAAGMADQLQITWRHRSPKCQ